jgi:hypothetical protein
LQFTSSTPLSLQSKTRTRHKPSISESIGNDIDTISTVEPYIDRSDGEGPDDVQIANTTSPTPPPTRNAIPVRAANGPDHDHDPVSDVADDQCHDWTNELGTETEEFEIRLVSAARNMIIVTYNLELLLNLIKIFNLLKRMTTTHHTQRSNRNLEPFFVS